MFLAPGITRNLIFRHQKRCITKLPVVLGRDGLTAENPKKEIANILRTTNDPFEVLNLLNTVKFESFEPQHLPQALARLLVIQKSSDNSVPNHDLIQHDAFDKIFLMLKKYAQHMKVEELLTCFKVLHFFGLSNESLAIKRVLNLIKNQLENLSPASLAFLNFLLTKGLRTPQTEAIKIAIPIVFNHNLSLKLDYENTSELIEILRYMTFLKVSPKSATNVATALALHGETLSVDEAFAIIRTLASMRNYDPVYDKVLQNCLNIVSSKIQELPFEEIDKILWRMTTAFSNGNESFYNEKFYDLCVSELIRRDGGYLNASYILKKFNKVLYVSFELLDYIDQKIVENHSNISTCKLSGLISFASGFSNANYKPKNWLIIKSLLHENPMLNSDQTNFPWLRFALDLMAIGFHSDILLSKIFSTSFLKQFLSRRENVLDQLQLLQLWQSVKLLVPDYKGPWPEQRIIDKAIEHNVFNVTGCYDAILADTFGEINEVVQKNVFTSHGHCLDYVISFDVNENPIAMPCRIKKFDEIPKSQVKSVAVMIQNIRGFTLNYPQRIRGVEELRQKTIQALGIRVVHISPRLFNELPDTEKISFLDREVRFALR